MLGDTSTQHVPFRALRGFVSIPPAKAPSISEYCSIGIINGLLLFIKGNKAGMERTHSAPSMSGFGVLSHLEARLALICATGVGDAASMARSIAANRSSELMGLET
jgi:hypothetical protein